ncbi:MAG: hypothetical protein A3F91_11015 [Flavobacteria bacterium RIFCSPLOWO2_12_FULL_35_11]|nr:MAG: hypothetical protein A3F91_11015 [Flavobacteria bacterium RIFCSPLOWO2_12_FULL_35_11]
MKKFAITTILLMVFSCFISCSSDDNQSVGEIIKVNTTISNSEIYTYNLGSFGDDEGAAIQKPAENFEISKLERNFPSGEIIYTYKPQSGFVGTDYVELKTSRGSNGASPNTNISIIKITIKVTA